MHAWAWPGVLDLPTLGHLHRLINHPSSKVRGIEFTSELQRGRRTGARSIVLSRPAKARGLLEGRHLTPHWPCQAEWEDGWLFDSILFCTSRLARQTQAGAGPKSILFAPSKLRSRCSSSAKPARHLRQRQTPSCHRKYYSTLVPRRSPGHQVLRGTISGRIIHGPCTRH